MPFNPISLLIKTIRGWFPVGAGWLRASDANHANKLQTAIPSLRRPIALFRRLERRRVFSVDAFFVSGALSIEISSVGETNANLISDGTDFFVDKNNNLTFEVGETTGALASLQSVHVFSNESIGKLFWNGDFSASPLSVPLGTGEVVRTENIAEVHVDAPFHAAGNVRLQAIDLTTINAPLTVDGNLHVTSQSGLIADGPGAKVHVLGNTTLQSDNTISLSDSATNRWTTDGLTSVESKSNVDLGQVGIWNSNVLRAVGSNVTVHEQDAIILQEIRATGSLDLIAQSSITDSSAATIDVAGAANLHGTSISLADQSSDILHVSGTTRLIATSGNVLVAGPGDVLLGNLSASGVNVDVTEDANSSLASITASGQFHLVSKGSITDIGGSNIQANTMVLDAGDFILLADNAKDNVLAKGNAFLKAVNDIEIAAVGTANFGSLGLRGNNAIVFEDSSTQLDGVVASSLQLHSIKLISQSGNDTGAGSPGLQISGTAFLSLVGGPGSIELLRASSNPPTTTSDGALVDNSVSGPITADGIQGDLLLRNVSPTASIGTLAGNIQDLSLWQTQASIVLPSQSFDIAGDLNLIAGVDVGNPIPLTNNPINTLTNTNAGIRDAGAKITVGGDAHFTSAASIMLNDSANELLKVANGSTSLISLGGAAIEVGSAGSAVLPLTGVSSKNIVNGLSGDVTLQIDGSLALTNPSLPEPDGRSLTIAAHDLNIDTPGDLTDVANTKITLDGGLKVSAVGNVQLSNNPGDSLTVAGPTEIVSSHGSIDVGTQGTVSLQNTTVTALVGDINVGGTGNTQLGTIRAEAINIRIAEDADMVLQSAVAANAITLTSSSSILNTTANGIVAKTLTIDAGTFAHLGKISVDNLLASVGGNGTLNNSGLFSLNSTADLEGQKYLDALNQNLPPGVSTSNALLSGETISALRARASFVQSFGREYGLFVQNDHQLAIQGISVVGDGVHSLIETPRGADIVVNGDVIQKYTAADPGGIVLIAGDELLLNSRATLQIINAAGDSTTSRVVVQPSLVANAFDGARGPAEYLSTRDVLYASDAFADSGTQNVLQRVSTQFGVDGESGFQTIVRYADGNSQLFDASQKLYASSLSGGSATGVLQSHVQANGEAAVFQRSTPFADTFLGTFQTLPTTAVFRRSSEFFLFEQGGRADTAVSKVDLTPVVDLVDNVFSPGRKVSFPMPTEIMVTPAILVAPLRVAPNADTVYPILNNDAETSSVTEATFEVFIIHVGFEDADRDGQPSDRELPLRSEIRLAELNESEQTEAAITIDNKPKLKPGEPDLPTKDTKGAVAPSAAEIQDWVDQYRDDPTKPAGAYAVVAIDSITGAKVLKIFGVRDFNSEARQSPEFAPEAAIEIEQTSAPIQAVPEKDRDEQSGSNKTPDEPQ